MLDPEDNNLSDIPDFDGLEEEAFPPLPPPHSPGRAGSQEDGGPFADGEDGDVSRLADVPAAKRKSVKRPQPKLDSKRLISERGLPALRTLFDNVRFRGKGHEAEDLRLLMQKMENWAHRLFPKLQFEDFINKVEKLGSKNEVQTCLKRIRLDMPLMHEDFVGKDGEEEAPPEMQVFGDPDPFGGDGSAYDPLEPVNSTPAPAAPTLTEEQRRRMELNRRRALEKRLARQQTDSQTVNTSLAGIEPLSVSAENVNSTEKVEDLDPDQSISMDLDPDCPSQAPPTNSEAPHNDTEGPPTDSEALPTNSKGPLTDSEAPPIYSETPPTNSEAPPTDFQVPTADSEAPPTESKVPPSSSEAPPTNSEAPPTDFKVPPTDTEGPPTDSEAPPTDSGPTRCEGKSVPSPEHELCNGREEAEQTA